MKIAGFLLFLLFSGSSSFTNKTDCVVHFNFRCSTQESFFWTLKVVERGLLFDVDLDYTSGYGSNGKPAIGIYKTQDTTDGEYLNDHYEFYFIVEHTCHFKYDPSALLSDTIYAICEFSGNKNCPTKNASCHYSVNVDFGSIKYLPGKKVHISKKNFCNLE